MSTALCQRYADYAIEHTLSRGDFDANAISVVDELESAGFDAFLVGGCLRDLMAGIPPKDFDVATSATPEQVCKHLKRSRVIGRRFKIAHVRRGQDIIEVTTFRGHSNKGQQKASNSGRLLRDNNYGNIVEDAERRDFSVNALYYHPGSNTILDFCDAVADIEAKTLRILGDAATRYREDPVRMIRAIRFAAKLGYELEDDTHTAIRRCGHHLGDVPAARLFDEIIKLFTNGKALQTLKMLEEEELLPFLLPETVKQMKTSEYARRFVEHALRNTDDRIKVGKFVAPAFLYATLLWPARKLQLEWFTGEGMNMHDANIAASRATIDAQAPFTMIPKRFGIPICDIWDLQVQFERKNPNRINYLMEHRRFRACYDFLLLRNLAGEELSEQCEWWTVVQQVAPEQQQSMVEELPKAPKNRKRSRKRRYLSS